MSTIVLKNSNYVLSQMLNVLQYKTSRKLTSLVYNVQIIWREIRQI